MTRPAPVRQADVARIVRGAIRGGLALGSFKIQVEGARVTLLPIGAASANPDAEDLDAEIEGLLRDEA